MDVVRRRIGSVHAAPRQRAVGPGQAFRVSSNNLADVDPSYAGQFNFFSPQKTFAVTGSTVMTTE